MGRRKGQIAMMAKCQLVKDRNRRPAGHRPRDDSFLHTTELDDGTTYNRINFQSVTEQNNLEDFLTTAEMAGRDFTAERQDIQIISEPGRDLHLTADDLKKISDAQETHKASLQIPRRPHWDKSTSKEELLLMEREAFTDWRRQLKILEEKDHIQLTPYEKNLDFWRQLWRVIERSDVIVQIVDARNPLLFHCEDLETYVKEVDPHKTCMLLVNKADFLTEWQREQWVEYFNKAGIRAVFFSAKIEKDRQESHLASLAGSTENTTIEEEEEEDDEDEEEEEEDYDDEEKADDADDEEVDDDKDAESEKESVNVSEAASSEGVSGSCLECTVKQTDTSDVNTGVESLTLKDNSKDTQTNAQPGIDTNVQTNAGTDSQRVSQGQTATSQQQSSTDLSSASGTNPTLGSNSPKIVSSDELLEIFRHLAHPAAAKRSDEKGEKTVGMVGYPNVGKSSTINVILEQKKLAVSATPGRTKHLQTLYVDSHLVLCDCPGLVFPSFVATKAHLVINGILPIDELRNHVPPVTLVCEQIPRHVLEATYSIMIPSPSLDDADANRAPTAEELLTAYGAMRGFMTPRGVPDCPRASRYILKDYVKGKLLYCEPPPGLDGVEFQDKERQIEICESKAAMIGSKPKLQIKSEIDKEFFSQKRTKAHTRGITGVSDFVRSDTLQQTGREADMGDLASGLSSSVSSMTSSMSQAGKPWKKHNNRNKKEKLRRLHRDLDI